MSAETIAADVQAERDRQDAKWGEQNHPDGTSPDDTPLMGTWLNLVSIDGCSRLSGAEDFSARELAEAATFATDNAAKHGKVTWKDILLEEVFEALAEDAQANLRAELIQVAAVAQQWVQAIDRRTT